MNTDQKKKVKNDFEKKIKLMNNAVKAIRNERKHKDIKIVTTGRRRRNYLVSEPNYHTTKLLTENLLTIEMKKIDFLMNKPLC